MKIKPMLLLAVMLSCSLTPPLQAMAGPSTSPSSIQTEIGPGYYSQQEVQTKEKSKEEIIKETKKQIMQMIPGSNTNRNGVITLGSEEKMNDYESTLFEQMFRYIYPSFYYYDESGNIGGVRIYQGDVGITDDSLFRAYNANEKAKENAKTAARGIISDGLSMKDAGNVIYSYIVDNYEYAAAARTDNNVAIYYSCANRSFESKEGTCVSLHLIFRAIFETIPFNPETGLTDWMCENPTYHKAHVFENPEHMWISITLEDGTLIDYDVTYGEYNKTKWMSVSHDWIILQKKHYTPLCRL